VSISTNHILFDSKFEQIKAMSDLLPPLSHKYRIFLITQIPSADCPEHAKAKQLIEELINREAIQEHRAMYCTTDKGKESLVR